MYDYSFFSPVRIRFAPNSHTELGKYASRYGQRCLLLTGRKTNRGLSGYYDKVRQLMGEAGLQVFHFEQVIQNPTVQCVENVIAYIRKERIDIIVAMGGGSVLDTAKAAALLWQCPSIEWSSIFNTYTSPSERYKPITSSPLPVIAVPTTSGTGSEVTQAMVLSDVNTHYKASFFHPQAFPVEAIIDPELTKSMPAHLTAITGFDAFSHALESYIRAVDNGYVRQLSVHAMGLIVTVLPKLIQDLTNLELRVQMSQASLLAGISLSNGGATIPHPLSEMIGGVVPGIAHGQALATLYPAYFKYLAKHDPVASAEISRIFDPSLRIDAEAAAALPTLIKQFLAACGLQSKLRQCGVNEDAQKEILSHPLLDVLPFASKADLIKILENAF